MNPIPPANRRQACVRIAAAALAIPGLKVFAQAYPSRPVRIIVPFTPGGSSDVLARAISQDLSRALGQPVVIENAPGAGGSLGAEKGARATTDGYTLLMGHIGTLSVNPWLYPKLGYDPVKSFAPVAWVARVPNVLVVHPSVPANSLKELVALAKARPGQLAYGSGGNGSAAHMTMEYLKTQTGTSLLHIPYRGAAPAGTPAEIVALLNQHVNKALGSEEVRTRLATEGAQPVPTTPEVFSQLIATELRRWEKVVKASGIKPD